MEIAARTGAAPAPPPDRPRATPRPPARRPAGRPGRPRTAPGAARGSGCAPRYTIGDRGHRPPGRARRDQAADTVRTPFDIPQDLRLELVAEGLLRPDAVRQDG
jgi:hypothetical protein